MKKRIIFTILIVLYIVFVFAMPALAAVYKYTGTSFFFIGDIFYEKEIKDFDGGQIDFRIEGKGTAQGSHDVHSVKIVDINQMLVEKKLNLDAQVSGTTAFDALDDHRMTLFNSVETDLLAISIGVRMKPNETGSIQQSVAEKTDSDGKYLKVENQFKNTGGVTARDLEIKGYITETIRVDGYAEVWESAKVSNGKTKTGWWDTKP